MNFKYMICIIIVTWNNENDIEECISSIMLQDYKDFRIIVVDNASSDKTISIVKEKFSHIDLIEEKVNHYLTGANNIGIKYALNKYKPEYIMVLNPDTKADSNLISELVKLMEDSEVGAVGPKIKFWKNKNEGLLNSAGLLYDGFKEAYDIGFLEEDKEQYDIKKEVFGVSGTCILYRVKMLEDIGIYWNRIKMYLDEVEMFIRAHKKGWKVIYNPKTTIWHNYMQSTNNNKLFNRRKQVNKAWLLIALRHYPIKSKIAMIKNFLIK